MPYPFSPSYTLNGLIDPGGMNLQDGTSPTAARRPPSINEGSSSDEMNATSLTSKMNNIFLETPKLSNPPEFSLSPVYALGGVLHTPSSMVVPTPVMTQGKFQTSPSMPYDMTGYNEPTNRVIKFEASDGQFDLVTHLSLQHHHSHSALQESFSENVPFQDTRGIETELEYEDDSILVSDLNFTTEKSAFPSVDAHVLTESEGAITIEQFLLQDPFESIENIPEVEQALVSNETSTLLPHIMEFPEKQKPPSPKGTPRKTSSSVKSKLVDGPIGFSPKVIRKTKSFSAATSKTPKDLHRPNFSFEDCSNEFHITDGNYAFQDETATISKQCDPGISASTTKKKLTAKTSKVIPKPVLRKAKSTFNLCLQASCRSNPKVLRNMESGLVSFQLQLKTFDHDGQRK